MSFKKSVSVRDEDNDDVIQKSIGSQGKWQFGILCLLFLVKFPLGWHQLCFIIESPKMNFTCSNHRMNSCDPNCPKHEFNKTIFTETITTQFDLVCEKQPLNELTQSVVIFGIMTGNIVFGIFGDKYGRRKAILSGIILQIIFGTWQAFVPWYWIFLLLRFLNAAAVGGNMSTSFVFVTELCGTKQRTITGILYQVPFFVAYLSLSLIGYYFRNWQHIQLLISLPSILLISCYWLLPESPRWLLTTRRTEEAIIILESAAKFNNLPTSSIRNNVLKYATEMDDNVEKTGNFIDLLKTSQVRKMTILASINWCICGFAFFGVVQYIDEASKSTDIFKDNAVAAIGQFPAIITAYLASKFFGNKITLLISMTLTGICFFLFNLHFQAPYISVLHLSVMTSMCTVFLIIYVHTGEVFPTTNRAIGIGICSVCARIGAMIAPFTSYLQDYATFTFGISMLVAAVFTIFLPESGICRLPDTISEIERLKSEEKRDYGTNC